MANLIARVGIVGDDHLSAQKYGGHVDYPGESLYYFKQSIDIMQNLGCTHMIRTGDLSFGKFHDLEYRTKVEAELHRANDTFNGNVYIVKGNHDKASYGMTEYEFYLNRGEFRGATILQLGSLNISMVNFGMHETTDVLIEQGKHNFIVAHDYFKFSDSRLPNYGDNCIELDNFVKWFGIEGIIAGHIHNKHFVNGRIIKDNVMMECTLQYLPCHARPQYFKDGSNLQTGAIAVLSAYDDGSFDYKICDVELLPLEKSFDIHAISAEQERKELCNVNIDDIVGNLAGHQVSYGDPKTNIMSMSEIPVGVREKAVSWLEVAASMAK